MSAGRAILELAGRADQALTRQADTPRWRPLDTPTFPGLVIMVAAGVFVVVRCTVAAHGNLSQFVVAGRVYVDPTRAPAGLHVFPGAGYDGQFYYRLALDPSHLSTWAHGIRLDTVYRAQRIGYPSIAWLVSGGQAGLVPLSMVLVNVAGLGVIAVGGGVMAQDTGRHAMWGLMPAAYFGFLMSLGRDTTEIAAAAFTMAGLLAIRRQRPLLAGLALAAAVLTQETALIVVAAVAAVRVFRMIRRAPNTSLAVADLAWILPVLAFVGWQLSLLGLTGHPPLRSDGSSNLGVPFDDLCRALAHYVSDATALPSVLWLGEVGVLILVVVSAALVIRHETRALAHERLAWLLFVVFAVCVSSSVWLTPVPSFRSIYGVFLLSAVVLLGSRRRMTLPACACAGAWFVVAVWLAVSV